MRELRVAQSAGFCFGVSRSVDMAEKLLKERGSCASFGELIHNEDVVRRLESGGLRVIHSPEELEAGEQALIRAHGVSREIYEELEKAGGTVVDATCPKVKAIHTIVSRAAEEGRFVIIIGMPKHPEVEGICGWCGEYAVFENSQDLEKWLDKNTEYWGKPITVVVQTTQTRNNFTECCNVIKKRCTNAKISDTICLATFTRQEEAQSLPRNVMPWWSSAESTAPTAFIWHRYAGSIVQIYSLLKMPLSWIWTSLKTPILSDSQPEHPHLRG